MSLTIEGIADGKKQRRKENFNFSAFGYRLLYIWNHCAQWLLTTAKRTLCLTTFKAVQTLFIEESLLQRKLTSRRRPRQRSAVGYGSGGCMWGRCSQPPWGCGRGFRSRKPADSRCLPGWWSRAHRSRLKLGTGVYNNGRVKNGNCWFLWICSDIIVTSA